MREILFRGKTESGRWVVGYYSARNCEVPFGPWKDDPHIIKADTGFWFRVNPETVGQYIGLKDKNGEMIFEGDICLTEPDPLNEGTRYVNIIEGDNLGFAYREKNTQDWEAIAEFNDPENVLKNWEIVGNIFDDYEIDE